jgi:nucleoside 2-deoxyribosyltransferase
MRIFFAGSIRGGRNLLPVYKQIIQMLKKLGHTIVSEHVASAKLEEAEAKLTEEGIFRSDVSFIDECDCLVAEVTMPSTGVGYEICYAVSKGKRVLCLYKEGTNVSAMVLGNRRVTSIQYVDVERLGINLALYFKNQTGNSGT